MRGVGPEAERELEQPRGVSPLPGAGKRAPEGGGAADNLEGNRGRFAGHTRIFGVIVDFYFKLN